MQLSFLHLHMRITDLNMPEVNFVNSTNTVLSRRSFTSGNSPSYIHEIQFERRCKRKITKRFRWCCFLPTFI